MLFRKNSTVEVQIHAAVARATAISGNGLTGRRATHPATGTPSHRDTQQQGHPVTGHPGAWVAQPGNLTILPEGQTGVGSPGAVLSHC